MLSKRNTARLASLTSLALISSGCASTSALRTGVPVPAALLYCRDEPRAPDPATATDVKVAKWEIELMAAGCDCRDKVAAIRALQAGRKPPTTSCTVR